jgi:hypothetical protein
MAVNKNEKWAYKENGRKKSMEMAEMANSKKQI